MQDIYKVWLVGDGNVVRHGNVVDLVIIDVSNTRMMKILNLLSR